MVRSNVEIYTPSFMNRLLNVILLCLTLCVLAYPLLYLDGLAGDALTHLVFAENAANGHFFTFNPNEYSSGETSTAYMLLLALLYKVFGAFMMPYILKGMSFFFWFLFIYLCYQFLKHAGLRPIYAYIGTLMITLMPGSVHNALQGMENILFADIVLLWVIYMLKWQWLIAPEGLSFKRESILGIILGSAVWLKPEAAIFLFLALSFRYCFLARKWNFIKLTKASLFCGMWTLFFTFLLFDVHYTMTGMMPFGAIEAQVHLSQSQAIHILGIPVNFKFIERLGYYFPLALLALIGLIGAVKKIPEDKINPIILHRRFVLLFSAFMFFMFFVLYSTTVLSSEHLARYIIFMWPFMVLLSTFGLYRLYRSSLLGKVISILLISGIVSIYCMEGYVRIKTLGHGYALMDVAKAPEQRKNYTDEFLESLEQPGVTPQSPIAVAAEAVQLRYFVDDRIIMRSLDGTLDTELSQFYDNKTGDYDHIGYLKARHIAYLLEYKNYNKNPSTWSLAVLDPLKSGEMVIQNGLLFKKLESGFTRVSALDTFDKVNDIPQY